LLVSRYITLTTFSSINLKHSLGRRFDGVETIEHNEREELQGIPKVVLEFEFD